MVDPASISNAPPDVNVWNENKKNNNCYAFAFNHLRKNAPSKLQPGQLSGLVALTDDQYNCHDMMARVLTDNPGVAVIDADEEVSGDHYRVALVLDNQGSKRDYHFYREVGPERWLHKPGSLRVSSVDDSGDNIKDPRTADRDYVNDGNEEDDFNYSLYCGMFSVPNTTTKSRQTTAIPMVLPLAIFVVACVCLVWALVVIKKRGLK